MSRDIGVPPNRISEMIDGRRGITADTALRLQLALGASAEFWMNLQTAFDLQEARMRMATRAASAAQIDP